MQNYVSQIAIRCRSSYFRITIMKLIKDQLVQIGSDLFGSHSLQGFVTQLRTCNEINEFIEIVLPLAVELSSKINAHHIVIKLIACIEEYNRQKLNYKLAVSLSTLVRSRYGVCVIKKLFLASVHLQMKLISETEQTLVQSMKSPFGNYFIQDVIELNDPEQRSGIIKIILEHIVELAINKYANLTLINVLYSII